MAIYHLQVAIEEQEENLARLKESLAMLTLEDENTARQPIEKESFGKLSLVSSKNR